MNIYQPYTIFPLGDAALTIEFSDTIDREINNRVLQLFHHLQSAKIDAIVDLIPAYSTVTVCYDPVKLKKPGSTAFENMAAIIETVARAKSQLTTETVRQIEVPVCYDPAVAPDLKHLAAEKKLSIETIITIHTSVSYRVFMLGFLPGFAYMGQIDERIAMPRKTKPMPVAAGSVGIAGLQTGIYPFNCPGGWHIIGRTPLKLFDAANEDPTIFHPGDDVRFFSITYHEFKNYQGRTA